MPTTLQDESKEHASNVIHSLMEARMMSIALGDAVTRADLPAALKVSSALITTYGDIMVELAAILKKMAKERGWE